MDTRDARIGFLRGNHTRLFWAGFAAALLYAAAILRAQQPGPDQNKPPTPPLQDMQITLTPVGDAEVSVVTSWERMPKHLEAVDYAHRGIAAEWVRSTGLHEHWFKLEKITLDAKPSDRRFTTTYVIPGFARRTSKGWEFRCLEEDQFSISHTDSTLTYSTVVETALGQIRRSVRINVPAGAKLAVTNSPLGGAYELADPAAKPDAKRNSADLSLDAAPQLMACLAKCYGYEKFPALWVGRTRIVNAGDGVITDYRVRFRLTDYSPNWTPWKRTPVILPGQTVVDPYFPVLDVDKVSRIEGTRQCTMEIEYEYRLASGEVVKDSDGRKIELAGRNERLHDSGNADAPFNLTAHRGMLCAAFVSKDDPVVQTVAGRISGQVKGGLAPLISPRDAVEYMRQIHRFVLHNKISYQTPPADDLMQYHRYAREVLQSKSGTCVDLANMYASLCEAVGLKVTLLLPRGHCFMMIKLPEEQLPPTIKRADGTTVQVSSLSEQEQDALRQGYLKKLQTDYPFLYREGNELYCPMECTFVTADVSFEKAAAHARAAILSATNPPEWVDINSLRVRGIRPIELPDVPADVLDKWHISAAPTIDKSGVAAAATAGSMIGKWRCEFTANGQRFGIVSEFKDDGTMTADVVDMTGRTLVNGGGKWSVDDAGNYVYEGPFREEAKIRWINADSFGYTPTKSDNPQSRIGVETINRRVK